jgi:hypothetical protein
MKKRLHTKKAGIALLLALIIISLAEIIFRAIAMGKAVLTTPNVGEQVAVVALAVILLIMTAKGKDRLCYILYGALVSYFVFDQLFELPGFISQMAAIMADVDNFRPIGTAVMVLYALSMAFIIGIGVLLVEYMNDGTIYNKAFNTLCVIALAAIVLPIIGDVVHLVFQNGGKEIWLSVFNNLYRGTMIFLFTFFAYDSAKHQLKKTDFTK